MVEFRLLGPVEVIDAGRLLDPGTPKRRGLLAALLIDAGVAVSIDALVDRVWDDAVPAQARKALHAHLSRIRGLLAQVDRDGTIRLSRRSGGYAIELPLDTVDVHRGRRLLGEARHEHHDDQRRAVLLREAIALWRGEPLTGVSGRWADQTRQALHQQHLDTAALWARTELRLGNADALIGPLTEITSRHPLAEPLAAALMRALHAAGDGARALDYYGEIRELLADELGTDPSAELQQLHQEILRDKTAPDTGPPAPPRAAVTPPAPAMLPIGVHGFTGRARELAQLDATLDNVERQPTAVVISAIAGTAGVGKTALAVHWARLIRHRFPDGQLYVNLRGFDASATIMEPITAIRTFLDGLGVAPERVPATLEAAAGLYRSLLADRRVLVVLDNARDADQVRPLLPGSAGCLVVVTSRNALAGLVAIEGARPLTLDLPSTDDALQLLTRRLGPDRVGAEPHATGEIIQRCARLPLTLAIVAARAAARPDFPLEALAGELRDSGVGLDTWSDMDPAVDVRAVFSWSYHVLSTRAARLFRLLGLHPGPDITVAAAASLAGLPIEQSQSLLAELSHAHLLIEQTPRRYAFHDLLRTYAIELTHTRDTEADRNDAVRRILDHYLHGAFAAAKLLSPHRDPISVPPSREHVILQDIEDDQHALIWFATEHRMLLGAVDLATRTGFDAHVAALAWTLTDFLQRRGHWQEQAGVHTTALAAAQRLGDRAGQARAHRHLSRAYILLDRLDDAHAQYRHALDLAQQIGDASGQAHVRLNVANLLERQGRYVDALDHAQKALALFATVKNRSGQARARNMVGWFHARLGRYRDALAHCELALTELEDINDAPGMSSTLDSLGYAHHHLGHHKQAIACYQRALGLAGELGDWYTVTEVLIHLGDTHQAAGDGDAARDVWQRALDILDDYGHPDAEQVRGKLKQP